MQVVPGLAVAEPCAVAGLVIYLLLQKLTEVLAAWPRLSRRAPRWPHSPLLPPPSAALRTNGVVRDTLWRVLALASVLGILLVVVGTMHIITAA